MLVFLPISCRLSARKHLPGVGLRLKLPTRSLSKCFPLGLFKSVKGRGAKSGFRISFDSCAASSSLDHGQSSCDVTTGDGSLGESLRAVQFILEEHFDAGTPVLLVVGVDRTVDPRSVRSIAAYLQGNGLTASVEYGSTPKFPQALLFGFRRPRRKQGLAGLLLKSLEAEGIHEVLGAVAEGR